MRAEFPPLGGRKVTASFGVAEMEPGDSVASLLTRADRGLYLSKGRGRNRVTALRSGQLEEDTLAQQRHMRKTLLDQCCKIVRIQFLHMVCIAMVGPL